LKLDAVPLGIGGGAICGGGDEVRKLVVTGMKACGGGAAKTRG
jgi:hypothetical protein